VRLVVSVQVKRELQNLGRISNVPSLPLLKALLQGRLKSRFVLEHSLWLSYELDKLVLTVRYIVCKAGSVLKGTEGTGICSFCSMSIRLSAANLIKIN